MDILVKKIFSQINFKLNFYLKASVNQLSNKTLTPYITGSNFKDGVKYYLKEFHFHWGFNVYQGSEHHLNSQKFPLEVKI